MIDAYPLSAVRLLPGPFLDAQRTGMEYLLSLDPARLLAPVRREAGLPSLAEAYPNWESMGLDGHTLGHATSAAARLVAATEDPRVRPFLDRLVEGVAEAQRAGGDGYVGGVPGGRELWARVAAGDVTADSFGLNGAWVPWYNLHKLLAGLVAAYRFAGSSTALDVALRFADWWSGVAARLDDRAHEAMLDTEFGGMSEALADLAEVADRPDVAALARRFLHRRLLDPILAGEDRLDGLHANTQIAKAAGYQRLGEVEQDEALLGAARLFWQTVVRHRTFSIGGNSVSEHFPPADDAVGALTSPEGPESCNTTNMLTLSRALWLRSGEAEAVDHYERATLNHVLSTQRPTGGFVYFTPLRPDHYRVYSSAQECFWCCVGTGLENHTRYGELVWARHGGDVLLNLGIASRLHDAERGLTLEQTTTATDDGPLRVEVVAAPAEPFGLGVRLPSWAAGPAEVLLDGGPVEATTRRLGTTDYLRVERTWSAGDVLTVDLPRAVAVEPMPGNPIWVSFVRGPVVLAARTSDGDLDGLVADDARMGHVAAGPLRPLADVPVVVGDPRAAVRDDGDGRVALDVDTVGNAGPVDTADQGHRTRRLLLEPFASLHDTRYSLYLPHVPAAADVEDLRDRLRRVDAAGAAWSERVLDAVAAGRQQPEVEHAFRGDGRAGFGGGRWWRTTTSRFSYDLATGGIDDLRLVVSYLPGGTPTEVLADGVVVLTLPGGGPGAWPVDAETALAAAGGTVTVSFSVPGGESVRVLGCRLER